MDIIPFLIIGEIAIKNLCKKIVVIFLLAFISSCGATKNYKILQQKTGVALERYIDNGDGTITDTRTNLMWTKEDSYADLGKCLDWNNSRSYVSSLTTALRSDWRMPTVKELKKIYEKSKPNRRTFNQGKWGETHLDSIFADGAAYGYWSSETAGSCCARSVLFDDGDVSKDSRDTCNFGGVRAVRP